MDFLIDFFDPTFRRFVTPVIVTITWVVVLVVMAGVLVLGLVPTEHLNVDEPSVEPSMEPGERRLEPAGSAFWRNLQSPQVKTLAWIVGCGLVTLWARVVLEGFVIVFRIYTSLESIRRGGKGLTGRQ